jgi:NAD(P)-dependent dehydrogenase (short-subunit alcohol dehydrogenase family)
MAEHGPITTPFGSDSTAAEVVAGVDLAGRRAVVTGASSGIGIETARALASAGAEVTLAVRGTAAGRAVAADITASTGNENVTVTPLELADRASIRAFVDAWTGPLHILVNNAGIMATPLMRTDEGWELQFATNHLGHFGLATGLRDALAEAQGARVVSVSSNGHMLSPVVFDDIHFERREYQPWLAYGQSKTANVLFAVEASRRWARDGITVNAVHPGVIGTNLSRHLTTESLQQLQDMRGDVAFEFKSAEQGAATSVLVATWPALEGIGGRYFDDCNESAVGEPGTPHAVAPHALDPEAATRLWDVSEEHLSG